MMSLYYEKDIEHTNVLRVHNTLFPALKPVVRILTKKLLKVKIYSRENIYMFPERSQLYGYVPQLFK